MTDLLSIYAPRHRRLLLTIAAGWIAAIAGLDFLTKPYISLGFLYLFPIMIAGGFLKRGQTVAVALLCAVAQEAFSNLPANQALVRVLLTSAGFAGTGLFIGELIRNRQIVLKHVSELETQERLRRDAEIELQFLVDTSPAAIVTVNAAGRIVLANEAAHRLLGVDPESLRGQAIGDYVPALENIAHTHASHRLRTTLQCRGRQHNGQAFLAGVWFSTYITLEGPRMAAILVDLSEDLRNREDLRFEHLLRSTRILMSAVTHEVRNICSAALVSLKNLSQADGLARSADFQALCTLLGSLETVLALELQPSPASAETVVDLGSVFDEVRVLLDAACQEVGVTTHWDVPEALPLVAGERFGLIQVFLNLTRNSLRAMETSATRRLHVQARDCGDTVMIRVEDTGTGVQDPTRLFRPFHPGSATTGLGLYVSRAIIRSFGGDLVYDPGARGAGFAISLAVRSGTHV